MSNWMMLDPSKVNPGRKEDLRGADVTVFVSPADVPEAVRGSYSSTKVKRFVVEFKYSGDEPWEELRENDFLITRVGKTSRRLFGFEIDVEALDAHQNKAGSEVQQALSDAISRLARQPGGAMRRGNYSIAGDVIESSKDRIFAELTPVA